MTGLIFLKASTRSLHMAGLFSRDVLDCNEIKDEKALFRVQTLIFLSKLLHVFCSSKQVPLDWLFSFLCSSLLVIISISEISEARDAHADVLDG